MRRLALLLFVTTTAPALAASPDPGPARNVRSQFYIFDGSSFEAGPKSPSIGFANARAAARFGRLLSLKKDLLGGLGGTLKERSLK